MSVAGPLRTTAELSVSTAYWLRCVLPNKGSLPTHAIGHPLRGLPQPAQVIANRSAGPVERP